VSARVVITTVGPYVKYGDPLVATRAEAGTDYVDLTGEPEFVDRTYVVDHARAVESGARIVHACGFDSIPHDLGAYLTVKQLPDGVPVRRAGFVRTGGRPSGGIFSVRGHGVLTGRDTAKASRERRRLEPRPQARRVRAIQGRPRHESAVDAWMLPLPTIDAQVIRRSARVLERYGPDFSYGHYVAVKRLPVAAGMVGGVAGLFALAQLPPTPTWADGSALSTS
jgi:short subunit dehydrogenase-like uncharacterized protein